MTDRTSPPKWSGATWSDAIPGWVARRAETASTYLCPICGVAWVGVTIHGRIRRACPDPACRRVINGKNRTRQRTKVSPDQVRAIRQKSVDLGYKAIAAEYGISPGAVRDIIKGRTHRGIV